MTKSPSKTTSVRRRWPRGGRGQKPLLGATVMVMVGSFMPWIDTAFGTVSGARGAGLWTFYAATLGLAGAMVGSRLVAAFQATVFAAVAITLPAWQVLHLLNQVGMQGWLPGPGIVLTFGGGVLAAAAAWSLFRERPVEP